MKFNKSFKPAEAIWKLSPLDYLNYLSFYWVFISLVMLLPETIISNC